jgi:hypothetical protein
MMKSGNPNGNTSEELLAAENTVAKKKVYPNALYMISGPLGQDAIEKWLDKVIQLLRRGHFAEDFRGEIKYEVDVLPISLLNPPTIDTDGSLVWDLTGGYLQTRAEIEADNLLRAMKSEGTDFGDKMDSIRDDTVYNIRREFVEVITKDHISSKYKLNGGIAYVWSNSADFINVLKGYLPDGRKVMKREFPSANMTDEIVEAERAKLYFDNGIMDFVPMNVEYAMITSQQLPIVVKHLLGGRQSREDEASAIVYTVFFGDLIDEIMGMLNGTIAYTTDNNREDWKRAGRGGAGMSSTEADITEATLAFIRAYNFNGLTRSLREDNHVTVNAFMRLIKKYSRALELAGRTHITKVFDSIYMSKTVVDLIKAETKRQNEFSFSPNAFTDFLDREIEPIRSYIERIRDRNVSNLTDEEYEFLRALFLRYAGETSQELRLPENSVFDAPSFLVTLNHVTGRVYTLEDPNLLKLRLVMTNKQVKNMERLTFIDEVLDSKYGRVIMKAAIDLPDVDFTPSEELWLANSNLRIHDNIVKLASVNGFAAYEPEDEEIMFKDLYSIFVEHGMDAIPDESPLSVNYRSNGEHNPFAPIDELAQAKIKEEFSLYRAFAEKTFKPHCEDFMFAPKDGLGVKMKYNLKGKAFINAQGAETTFDDVFYEPQETTGSNRPNPSAIRKIKPNGAQIIADYFRERFEKFISTNKDGFYISVTEEMSDEIEGERMILMVVNFTTQETTFLASKFYSVFFTTKLRTLLMKFRDVSEIPNKYILTWKRSSSQSKILAGENNRKTLKVYDVSMALRLQYPFYDGRFMQKLNMIKTALVKKLRPRMMRSITDALRERSEMGLLGTRTDESGELMATTILSETTQASVRKWMDLGLARQPVASSRPLVNRRQPRDTFSDRGQSQSPYESRFSNARTFLSRDAIEGRSSGASRRPTPLPSERTTPMPTSQRSTPLPSQRATPVRRENNYRVLPDDLGNEDVPEIVQKTTDDRDTDKNATTEKWAIREDRVAADFIVFRGKRLIPKQTSENMNRSATPSKYRPQNRAPTTARPTRPASTQRSTSTSRMSGNSTSRMSNSTSRMSGSSSNRMSDRSNSRDSDARSNAGSNAGSSSSGHSSMRYDKRPYSMQKFRPNPNSPAQNWDAPITPRSQSGTPASQDSFPPINGLDEPSSPATIRRTPAPGLVVPSAVRVNHESPVVRPKTARELQDERAAAKASEDAVEVVGEFGF